jgi:glycosyltransferase involved in cell wall biosynthesis
VTLTIYTNFKLPNASHNVRLLNQSDLKAVGLIQIARGSDSIEAFLIANPSTLIILRIGILKFLKVIRCPIFFFDLILKRPEGLFENFVARVKGMFIRRTEYIVVIHRDTSGYEKYYGLRADQFVYVPFKANNIATYMNYDTNSENYVVALGASQRDYKTLIEAAKFVDSKIVIVCSDENAEKHNANIKDVSTCPENVIRIRDALDSHAWYTYLAKAKFVVVPILANAIQPAGISVYLEAMMFRKAVIVSQGASTNSILEHGVHAILVPPGNTAELANAINRLISDADYRARLEANGFQYALSLGDDEAMRENILNAIIDITSLGK